MVARLDRTLQQISRILQPIGNPRLNLVFDIECASEDYKRFCKLQVEDGTSSFAGWPHKNINRTLFSVVGRFWKNSKEFDKFILETDCPTCENTGDAYFSFEAKADKVGSPSYTVDPQGQLPHYLSISIDLTPTFNGIIGQKSFTPKTGKILSVPDLYGGALIIMVNGGREQSIMPSSFTMRAQSGQEIRTLNFEKQTKNSLTFYKHVFDDYDVQ